jgi:hypothetical protein
MNRRQALTQAIQALASVPVLGWWVRETESVPHKSFVTLDPPLPVIGDTATSGCVLECTRITGIVGDRYLVTYWWRDGDTPLPPYTLEHKAV